MSFPSGDVSISSARIKQSDGRGLFEIFEGVKDLGSSLGNLVGSESNETIGFDIAEVVADSVSLIGTSVGSESTENIGIVGKLVGKLIENTAFSGQSYNSSFKLRRIPIYRLIYTVQNEQIMLAEPGVEPIQMKQSEFLDAKHISEFAINVYNVSADDTELHETSWPEDVNDSQRHDNLISSMKLSKNDEILFSWFKHEEDIEYIESGHANHVPHFMIFTDKSTKSVVLAIKGTDNVHDGILNGVASAIPFLDGNAHRGMAESSERVIELSHHILNKAFKTYPGYRLVITGHSLGGGVAVLTTLSILSRTDIIDPENVEVKCIVIAPPPVYHSTKPMDQFKKHIQIFINRHDVVPRLSMYTLAKFYEAASIIDELKLVDLSTYETIKTLAGWSTVDQQTSQKIIEVMDTATVRNNTFIELEHPGQIFYLDHAEDSEIYGIYQTPKDFFAKMLLGNGMINNHLGEAYKKAFDNVELGK